ncbi:hypothetical protein H6F67_25335 [Microcoleus sp. FACHB-1515]|uniref:hypothetical protein n=1 Tax=Cyanophyceae TaxID=3028117 RepID=UPI0016889A12|nr:hypothetical protein [Microcoleus sp. FACHB-1515]MBD2093173.1 hypothetical protein [Microcoleus sp. FACHB-1515]
MKFVRFENRLINLEAIANVHFELEPVPQVWIDYIGDGLVQIEGDRATELWELLLQHSSGAIEKIDLLTAVAQDDLLQCVGMHLAALTIAADLIADDTQIDSQVILMRLLKQGKARFDKQSPEELSAVLAELDRNLATWEAAGDD